MEKIGRGLYLTILQNLGKIYRKSLFQDQARRDASPRSQVSLLLGLGGTL